MEGFSHEIKQDSAWWAPQGCPSTFGSVASLEFEIYFHGQSLAKCNAVNDIRTQVSFGRQRAFELDEPSFGRERCRVIFCPSNWRNGQELSLPF
jgi:hypothetical protein